MYYNMMQSLNGGYYPEEWFVLIAMETHAITFFIFLCNFLDGVPYVLMPPHHRRYLFFCALLLQMYYAYNFLSNDNYAKNDVTFRLFPGGTEFSAANLQSSAVWNLIILLGNIVLKSLGRASGELLVYKKSIQIANIYQRKKISLIEEESESLKGGAQINRASRTMEEVQNEDDDVMRDSWHVSDDESSQVEMQARNRSKPRELY